MKRKDITLIVITVVIIAVAGYLAYGALNPSSKSSSNQAVQVEDVPVISSDFNNSQIQQFSDPTVIRDFSPVIDLTTGLNNPAPFGSF